MVNAGSTVAAEVLGCQALPPAIWSDRYANVPTATPIPHDLAYEPKK